MRAQYMPKKPYPPLRGQSTEHWRWSARLKTWRVEPDARGRSAAALEIVSKYMYVRVYALMAILELFTKVTCLNTIPSEVLIRRDGLCIAECALGITGLACVNGQRQVVKTIGHASYTRRYCSRWLLVGR